MESQNSFDLLQQYRDGVDDAATQLFERYFEKLERLAERKMSGPLRQRVGAEDVAQSVYNSFFARAKDPEKVSIEGRGQLWKALAHSTNLHIMRHVEKNKAAKRNMGAETPLNAGDDDGPAFELADYRGGDPALEAEIEDAMNSVLAKVCSKWSDVIRQSQIGTSVTEIAEALDVTATQVRKVLILRFRCPREAGDTELAECLDCAESTVNRLWRQLLDEAKGMNE